MAWTVAQMAELGMRHSTLEAQGKLEPLLETLVEDPVYEFQPIGLGMRGGDLVRRFYTQFCERFLPMRHGYELISQWVSESSVAQEYDVSLRVLCARCRASRATSPTASCPSRCSSNRLTTGPT